MSAQEAERTRVARELHDGIGQEIALPGIQMQRAAASPALEPGLINAGMQKLCANLTAIGLHVSHLSINSIPPNWNTLACRLQS
jgi:two-component system sensor histidine kinase NreB